MTVAPPPAAGLTAAKMKKHQYQYYHVAAHHVGEQTYRQCGGLGEHAEDFDGRHDGQGELEP